MEGKLQELTNKIYKEGIEKAENEGKSIIEDAKNKAREIIKNADAKAGDIINNAKIEAENISTKTVSELKMASSLAQITLKQEITNILSRAVLNTSIKKVFSEKDFIKELIYEIINKWDREDTKKTELDIILPEKSKNEFLDFFKTQTSAILNKGICINFDERMDDGFKISQKDGSFVLSFTEKDFIEFFQSFLKPKSREILFPGK